MELLRAKINNIVQKRQDMLSKTPAELRADKLKELENNLLISEKYYFTLFDRLIPFFLIIIGLVGIVYFNAQLKKRKKNDAK